MAPIIVLVGAYALLWAVGRALPLLSLPFRMSGGTRGRLALALMLCFTGFAHFIIPADFMLLVPGHFPQPRALVYLSGTLEVMAAVGIMVPYLRRTVGVFLIVMLLALVPVHVWASMSYVPLGGHAWGPAYLYIRLPMQLVFILWAWWFTLRRERTQPPGSVP